jgi:hypothetical protein
VLFGGQMTLAWDERARRLADKFPRGAKPYLEAAILYGPPAPDPKPRTKPIIFLDVEGVLNIPTPEGTRRNCLVRPTVVIKGTPYPVVLKPHFGEWLRELRDTYRAQLVWASPEWQGLANLHIGPPLGLPEMPFVRIPPRKTEDDALVEPGRWKARPIMNWAKGRPFVWFDNTPAGHMRSIAKTYDSPYGVGACRTIYVRTRTGLTPANVAMAGVFLETLEK